MAKTSLSTIIEKKHYRRGPAIILHRPETMTKHTAAAFLIASILLSLFGLNLSCSSLFAPRLEVVAGTTQIAAVVTQIGGRAVNATSIVPPAQNPLKYELQPEEMEMLSGAEIIVIHDWQKDILPQELTERNNATPPIRIFQLSLHEDWLLPAGQLEAAEKIADVLAESDPNRANVYLKAAATYQEEIRYREAHMQAVAESAFASGLLPSTNVICEEHLEGFLTWLGFGVTATFNELEANPDEVINALVAKGKEENVTVVVDSLQYSRATGVKIASKLLPQGGTRLLFSNFPQGFTGTKTWSDTILNNAFRIFGSS
ncbi:MAG: metal ABC transporter substrate-binding protein [Chloroflexota bacterium]